jgi:hypothetical protein
MRSVALTTLNLAREASLERLELGGKQNEIVKE